MKEHDTGRRLTGWQRENVLLAAEYVRELALTPPGDRQARRVYEALLEVLEPTRRVARQHREGQNSTSEGAVGGGSMWDRRSDRDRRGSERRRHEATPAAGGERRHGQRRSGRDRRSKKA